MKKIISTITFLALFSSIFFVGAKCSAQSPSVNFAAVGGNEMAGYINSTNTGFAITAHIPEIAGFDYAAVKINDNNLVGEINASGSDFDFKVGDLSLDEFKVWFPEGPNTVGLYAYDNMAQIIGVPTEILVTADYETADANLALTYNQSVDTTPGYLRVGDSANITISSDEKLDTDSIYSMINGREMSWVEEISLGEFRYLAQYEVLEGDSDLALPYQVEVAYTDFVGNEGRAVTDLDNAIDSNLPIIEMESIIPGQIFSNSDVLFEFNQSEPLSSYAVLLDGEVVNVVSGGVLSGLADGEYTLEVNASDLAGNTATLETTFGVDTTVPTATVTSSLGDSYAQGDELVIEGKTEPGSSVVVEVHSGIMRYETISDSKGNWRITINTSKLSVGSHRVYLEITDLAGNKSRVLLGVFALTAPVVADVSESVVDAPVKLAEAQLSEVVSDVQPPVIVRKVADEAEIASPKIIASSDERVPGTNWSAWLILLGLVVVSFLVAGVSYYGYSRAVIAVNRNKTLAPSRPPINPEERSEGSGDEVANEISSEGPILSREIDEQGDDEDDVQARW